MKSLYSICGVYSQAGHGVLPFGGFILRNEPRETEKTFEGKIADFYGLAEIVGSFQNEEELEFDKDYGGGRMPINYRMKFDMERKLWLGECDISGGISGKVICEIYPAIKFLHLDIEQVYTTPEEWARNLLDTMVDEGYLTIEKDENGREIVLPGKDPNDVKKDIPF